MAKHERPQPIHEVAKTRTFTVAHTTSTELYPTSRIRPIVMAEHRRRRNPSAQLNDFTTANPNQADITVQRTIQEPLTDAKPTKTRRPSNMRRNERGQFIGNSEPTGVETSSISPKQADMQQDKAPVETDKLRLKTSRPDSQRLSSSEVNEESITAEDAVTPPAGDTLEDENNQQPKSETESALEQKMNRILEEIQGIKDENRELKEQLRLSEEKRAAEEAKRTEEAAKRAKAEAKNAKLINILMRFFTHQTVTVNEISSIDPELARLLQPGGHPQADANGQPPVDPIGTIDPELAQRLAEEEVHPDIEQPIPDTANGGPVPPADEPDEPIASPDQPTTTMPHDRRGYLRNGVNPAVVTAAGIAIGAKVTRNVLKSVPFIGAIVAGGTSLVGTALRRRRGIRQADGTRREVTTMDELNRYSHIDSRNLIVRIAQGYTRGAEKNLVLMRAAGVTSNVTDRMARLQIDTGTTVEAIQSQTNPDGSYEARMTPVPQIDLDAFTNMSRTQQLQLLGDAYRHIYAVDTALSTGVGLSANQRRAAQESRDQAEEFAQMYLGVMYSDDGRPSITDASVASAIAQREDQLEARGRRGAMWGMAGLAAAKTLLFTGLGAVATAAGIVEDITDGARGLGGDIRGLFHHGTPVVPPIKPLPQPVPTPTPIGPVVHPVGTPTPIVTPPTNDLQGDAFGAKGNPHGFGDKLAPHGLNTNFANKKEADLRGWTEGLIARTRGDGKVDANPASTHYQEFVFDPKNGTQVQVLDQAIGNPHNANLVNDEVVQIWNEATPVVGSNGHIRQLGDVRLENFYDVRNPLTGKIEYDAKINFVNNGHVQHIDTPGATANAHEYAVMEFQDQIENPQLHPEFWRGQLAELLHDNSKRFAQLRNIYANTLQNNPNIIPNPLKQDLLNPQNQDLFERYFNADGTLKIDASKIPGADAQRIVQIINRLRVNPVLKNIAA